MIFLFGGKQNVNKDKNESTQNKHPKAKSKFDKINESKKNNTSIK